MVALAEQASQIPRRLSSLFHRRQGPTSQEAHKPSPEVKAFRQELKHLKEFHNPNIDYLLMSGVEGQSYFTVHLYSGDVRIPSQEAFGVLDLNGRQGKYYAWEDEKRFAEVSTRDAVHPNVFDPYTVYVERNVYDSSGEKVASHWILRATKAEDTKLSYVNAVEEDSYESVSPSRKFNLWKKPDPAHSLNEGY